MQPKSLPNRTHYDFGSKAGAEKFFAVVKAAQEETIRNYLERSDFLMREDIDAAWKVLVPSGEPSITRSDLVDRLSFYVPHTDTAATSNLIGGGGSMTLDKLARLLWNDTEPAFPCNVATESWALLDPHGRGSVQLDMLLKMLTTVSGCDKLDYDDTQVVRQLLEMTPEGNIVREENWQQLGTWTPVLEELTAAQRRILAARGVTPGLRGPARLSGTRWS